MSELENRQLNNGKKSMENRIVEIDLIRGICVLLMIVDHLLSNVYDFMPYIFSDFPSPGVWTSIVEFSRSYWEMPFRTVGHYLVCFLFLSITGISSSFSRNNLLRGFKLMGVALGLTLATYLLSIYMGSSYYIITFGVLHCIALGLILVGLLGKIIKNPYFYLVLGLITLVIGIVIEAEFTRDVSYGSENIFLIIFYEIIGTKQAGMDCFPFLLNGSQIFIGVGLGKLIYKNKTSIFNWKYKNNFITTIGRNSLLVYLLHQIILPVVMGLVLIIFGFHLSL